MGNVTVFHDPKSTSNWLEKLKPQMALALPKHMSTDRMARLVLTAISSTPALAQCTPISVASSIMVASQLGLEPGVNGQGYLIPYKTTCTFVPGWKGLVDLANRGGRCTVWTGAVFKGDDFDYQLGDKPYVHHRPGDEFDESYANLLYVYACGRIKGQEVPVIEVWSRAKVERHLGKFNKQGDKHYALAKNKLNFVMYARKLPLLQVLKYMPQSVELTAAMAAQNAADAGRTIDIDSATWVTTEDGRGFDDDDDTPETTHAPTPSPSPRPTGGAPTDAAAKPETDPPAPSGAYGDSTNGKPWITDAELAKKKTALVGMLQAGESVNDVIAAIELKNGLKAEQKMEVASWAQQLKTQGA